MRVSMTLGSRIKAAREDADLSAAALAHALGVHFTTVYRWERDKGSPGKLAIREIERITRTRIEPRRRIGGSDG